MYNHWGSTSINRPLSYPCRSLTLYTLICSECYLGVKQWIGIVSTHHKPVMTNSFTILQWEICTIMFKLKLNFIFSCFLMGTKSTLFAYSKGFSSFWITRMCVFISSTIGSNCRQLSAAIKMKNYKI